MASQGVGSREVKGAETSPRRSRRHLELSRGVSADEDADADADGVGHGRLLRPQSHVWLQCLKMRLMSILC